VPADGDPLLLLLIIRALLLQVSFFSTSPELSNKQRFEFFTRTIPSDHYQVKAMVDIVGRMGWKYISILYEESNYGIKVMSQTLFFSASISALVRSAPCWEFAAANTEREDYWLALIIMRQMRPRKPLFSA
jgi:Receptor family ligand binding region